MRETTEAKHLDLPGGRIAYDDNGDGPLVVCLPPMLEIRSTFRFLRPRLVEAGLRVVAPDQRGLGESSAHWPEYGSAPIGRDLIELLRHLDAGPALVYGCSMSAASAVYAAAEAPELIGGLVLAAPFVRDLPLGSLTGRITQWIATRPGLGRPGWLSYYPKMFPIRPDDFASQQAALRANLKEPGRRHAVEAYIRNSHAEAEARIDQVTAPALVIMGTADPDFPDPAAEGRWVAERLDARLILLDGGGHHPHIDHPDKVTDAILDFRVAHRL